VPTSTVWGRESVEVIDSATARKAGAEILGGSSVPLAPSRRFAGTRAFVAPPPEPPLDRPAPPVGADAEPLADDAPAADRATVLGEAVEGPTLVLVPRATDEVEALVPDAVPEECDELEPPQAASSSADTKTKARRITIRA